MIKSITGIKLILFQRLDRSSTPNAGSLGHLARLLADLCYIRGGTLEAPL